MTQAEKLQKIAENEERVYEAGIEVGKAEGEKSEYDRFWDNYQDYGNPKDYSCAFSSSWTEEIFKPKYDIIPTNAYMMFRGNQMNIDLVEHLKNLGITLDLSKATGTQYLFNTSSFTRIGVVDVSGSTNSSPLDSTFTNCKNLVTIDKIIPKVSFVGYNSFNSTFNNCISLVNITFGGTIETNGLNLQYSINLSHDSIVSIINALSSETSGKSITLSKHSVERAFSTDNVLQLMPNTDTSGATVTGTIYIDKVKKGTLCYMGQVEGGKRYCLSRNISGKPWRAFYYDSYPLNTGIYSIGGAYYGAGESFIITTTPENAKYIVVRGGEDLTDEEMENFQVTCGTTGTESQEWLDLIATKQNWTISLV